MSLLVVENVYSKQCGECPKNCDYGFEKFKKGSTCSCVCSKNPCEVMFFFLFYQKLPPKFLT